jgi:hypothetical protein
MTITHGNHSKSEHQMTKQEKTMLRFKSRTLRILTACIGISTIGVASAQQHPGEGDVVIHTFPGDLVYPESVAVDPASGRFSVG